MSVLDSLKSYLEAEERDDFDEYAHSSLQESPPPLAHKSFYTFDTTLNEDTTSPATTRDEFFYFQVTPTPSNTIPFFGSIRKHNTVFRPCTPPGFAQRDEESPTHVDERPSSGIICDSSTPYHKNDMLVVHSNMPKVSSSNYQDHLSLQSRSCFSSKTKYNGLRNISRINSLEYGCLENSTDNGICRSNNQSSKEIKTISATDSKINNGEDKIPTTILPGKLGSIFKFLRFNRMQSESFEKIYNSNDNCVISSPTGSGKTVLFELAILKLFGHNNSYLTNNKVLYLAPTKALCTERQKDWSCKFRGLNLSVGVLTSDTSLLEIENVKKSNIITSTPEKWDLLTRKWSDCDKLFSLVKLLLIDEMHILKDKRGSTLEVVTTRMNNMCNDLRIIALSATIFNVNDISSWLKLSSKSADPATTLIYDDSYRSVSLEKVVYGYRFQGENECQFDSNLNAELIDVIRQHSDIKPTLIFCPTRSSCINTANYLNDNRNMLLVGNASSLVPVNDNLLSKLTKNGIAFHHAGLGYDDRQTIEKSFIEGKIGILCSTSTLAVGVNLPAYLVIIKGTKCWVNGELNEYSETDVLQMMGRAGRPQFEKKGKTVIMTSLNQKQKYERLLNGTEKLESCLHLSFPEHLTAEVCLGTIKSLEDALKWIKSTFFYIRFVTNPSHYSEVTKESKNVFDYMQRLTQFFQKNLDELIEEEIINIQSDGKYKCTVYGDIMSKHYISFSTMKSIIRAKSKNSLDDLLLLLSKSSEFNVLRMKYPERRLYKEISQSPLIRYPLKFNGLQNYDKITLLLQYELGGLDYPTFPGSMKFHSTFLSDKLCVFKQAPRIIRGMIEVFVYKKDSISLLGALSLLRCVNGRCWEHSPMELRQIEGIGSSYIRKFIKHGIDSFESAEKLTATQIEECLGMNAGMGNKIFDNIQSIPKMSITGSYKSDKFNSDFKSIIVELNVSISVENSKSCYIWQGKFVFLDVVIELSTGELLDYRKISVSKINESEPKTFQFSANITNDKQFVNCHIFTESIASVHSKFSIEFKSVIDPWKFTKLKNKEIISFEPESSNQKSVRSIVTDSDSDTMSDVDLDNLIFEPVKSILTYYPKGNKKEELKNLNQGNKIINQQTSIIENNINATSYGKTSRKIKSNGNYECNHFCKNKEKCRHICCNEGIPVNIKNSRIIKKNIASPNESSETNINNHRDLSSNRHSPANVKQLEKMSPNDKTICKADALDSNVTDRIKNYNLKAKHVKKKKIIFGEDSVTKSIFDSSDDEHDVEIKGMTLLSSNQRLKTKEYTNNSKKPKHIFSIQQKLSVDSYTENLGINSQLEHESGWKSQESLNNLDTDCSKYNMNLSNSAKELLVSRNIIKKPSATINSTPTHQENEHSANYQEDFADNKNPNAEYKHLVDIFGSDVEFDN